MSHRNLLVSTLNELEEEQTLCVVYGEVYSRYHTSSPTVTVKRVDELSVKLLDELNAVNISLVPAGYDIELTQSSYRLKSVYWKIEALLRALNLKQAQWHKYKAICHNCDEQFEVKFNYAADVIMDDQSYLKLPEGQFHIDLLEVGQSYTIDVYDCYPEDDPGYVFDSYLVVND